MAYMQPNYGYPQYGYQSQFNQYQPQIQPQQPIVPQQSQLPSLLGKIVDGYNTADAQDIPLGMSGVYPKADGSAVFIKQWLDNGTTKTKEYRLIEETQVIEPVINWEEKLGEIYSSIDSLSKKLDKIGKSTPTTTTRKKKVVEEDEDYE